MTDSLIASSAIVHPSARLAAGVSVGPFSVIGENVEIGEGTWVGPHVVINGPTRIGRDNKIYQFSSIGDAPQDKKYHGEETWLEIGDRNLIRESCTINRGTVQGGGVTRIGDDNWIMAYVHIAHDCVLGNNIIMSNNASLAGHVTIEDYVILGGFTLVHQFCFLGAHCFTAFNTGISKDVPPFLMVSGYRGAPHGLNTEGLKRRGFSAEIISELRRAYKILYRSNLTVEQALEQLGDLAASHAEIKLLADFVQRSSRGIIR